MIDEDTHAHLTTEAIPELLGGINEKALSVLPKRIR